MSNNDLNSVGYIVNNRIDDDTLDSGGSGVNGTVTATGTTLKDPQHYIFNDVEVDSESVDLDDIVNKTPKLSLVNSGHLPKNELKEESLGLNKSNSSTPRADTTNTATVADKDSVALSHRPHLSRDNSLIDIHADTIEIHNNRRDVCETEDEDETEDESENDSYEHDEQHLEMADAVPTSPASTTSNESTEDTPHSISSPKNERNPFTLENRQSREIYTSKILDRQKSLENVPNFFSSNKPLINKRHNFIKKIVNRVFLTLKSATSEDLLTSQKNQILKELFRNVASELDDSVLLFLQCTEPTSKQQATGSPSRSLKSFSFSPLHLSADSIALPPMTLLNEYSNSPLPEAKLPHTPAPIDKSQFHSYPILDDKSTPTIYYYQLISQYFYNVPNEVDRFRPLLHSLWNNHWFFLIFSSLFNQWILEYRLSLIPQVNVFIKATNRLFWHDMDDTTHKFKDVYLLLKKKLLDGSLWRGLNEATDPNDEPLMVRNRRIWIDFYHIITVFYFYYEAEVDQKSLDAFASSVHNEYQDYINEKKESTESEIDQLLTVKDIFVRGIIRQLYLIKTEEVLIKYIELCTLFKGWSLNAVTKIKLQSCLYSFSKPGSPFHMPRDVRVASRNSLDILFPDGKISRHTVNLFFRLLHPYYSAGSIIHWIRDKLEAYIPQFILKRLPIGSNPK